MKKAQSPDVVDQEEIARARALIQKFGWNSTCYQILNPGMQRWFGQSQASLVGFMQVGPFAIVAGAPVCAEANVRDAVEEWEKFATRRGWRVIYFGAEGRLQACLRGRTGYTQVNLGCQPEWTPREFCQRFNQDRSLRAQRSRARHKGVTVREWSVTEAVGNPHLDAILRNWLTTRGMPPLHFLVEPQILAWLGDRRIFVAERAGHPVGFVSLVPVPTRNGWLTEHFLRSDRAPNGTVEAMLYAAAQAVDSDQASYWTMGIVPLTQRSTRSDGPAWLNHVENAAEAYFSKLYNFRGLERFKSKFHPTVWQPVVVIVSDSRFRVVHLRAIAQAFTVIWPERALIGGLWRALRNKLLINRR